MMLGTSVFVTSSAHKTLHSSVYWTSLDVSNQLTYSLYLLIHYYDRSDIEFYTIMKMSEDWAQKTIKWEEDWTPLSKPLIQITNVS